MTNQRLKELQIEIAKLKEIDKQITLKVQHRLNVMDQDECDQDEGEFLHGARLRESGISHDEYENGDEYDQGDSSHDAHYNAGPDPSMW